MRTTRSITIMMVLIFSCIAAAGTVSIKFYSYMRGDNNSGDPYVELYLNTVKMNNLPQEAGEELGKVLDEKFREVFTKQKRQSLISKFKKAGDEDMDGVIGGYCVTSAGQEWSWDGSETVTASEIMEVGKNTSKATYLYIYECLLLDGSSIIAQGKGESYSKKEAMNEARYNCAKEVGGELELKKLVKAGCKLEYQELNRGKSIKSAKFKVILVDMEQDVSFTGESNTSMEKAEEEAWNKAFAAGYDIYDGLKPHYYNNSEHVVKSIRNYSYVCAVVDENEKILFHGTGKGKTKAIAKKNAYNDLVSLVGSAKLSALKAKGCTVEYFSDDE